MYIAQECNGKRVYINEAKKGYDYYCPVCKGRLMIKDGAINAAHFAHISGSCTDFWHYDMSEWHKQMQGFFSEQYREVVVRSGGQTHRADVLVGSTVIEFQHSPISAEEYKDRTRFFRQCGYNIAWVFDVSEQHDNETISYSEGNNPYLMIWKHPFRLFSLNDNISESSNNYALWLYWCDDSESCGNRVIWTATDENGNPSLKQFIISPHPLWFHPKMEENVRLFFYSKKDYFSDARKELSVKHNYEVKYIGESGKPRRSYICPQRPEKFGLPQNGEKSCRYCKYCGLGAEKKRSGKNSFAFYCCYPHQVREVDEIYPGYECPEIGIFEL